MAVVAPSLLDGGAEGTERSDVVGTKHRGGCHANLAHGERSGCRQRDLTPIPCFRAWALPHAMDAAKLSLIGISPLIPNGLLFLVPTGILRI